MDEHSTALMHQMIESALVGLGEAMNGYPSYVPQQEHNTLRAAISEWRAGKHTPELTLYLSFQAMNSLTNKLRHRIGEQYQQAAYAMTT